MKNLPANAGNAGASDLTHGWGRPPGVGNGNPLHYTCLENPMDREASLFTIHRVAESWTRRSTQNIVHELAHRAWQRVNRQEVADWRREKTWEMAELRDC